MSISAKKNDVKDEVPDKKSGAKKPLPLLPIIAAAIAVLLVSGATFVFGQKVGASGKKPPKEPPGFRLKLEEMVVNLKGRDQFVKASPEIEFKMPGRRGEEDAKKFAEYTSRIEGVLTVVFRATPVAKLETRAGIEAVEKQMIEQINQTVQEKNGKVRDVVIGKFATQ